MACTLEGHAMTAVITKTPSARSGSTFLISTEEWDAPNDGEWAQFGPGPVTVGVGGDASSYTIQVERTFGDPTGFSAGTIAGPPITGVGSATAPTVYQENAIGWWRVKLTAIGSETVVVGMSG